MKNKKTILIGSLIALVAILAVIFFIAYSSNTNELKENKPNESKTGVVNNKPSNDASKPSSELDLSNIESSDVETFAKVNNLEIIEAGEIPEEAIEASGEAGVKTMNLSVSETGFKPSEFKVKAGQVVTVNLGAIGEENHAFKFVEEDLMASSVVVGDRKSVV